MKTTELLSHPWASGIGAFISLFGVVCAFYFYEQSNHKRDLRLVFEGHRNQTIDDDQRPQISAPQRSSPGTSAVLSSGKLYIWNDGTEVIKVENILDELLIKLADIDARIVSLRLISEARMVSQLECEIRSPRTFAVRFSVLEQYDGGIIKIVYEGDPNTSLEVFGAIEGIKLARTIKHSRIEPLRSQIYMVVDACAVSVVVLLFILFNVRLKRSVENCFRYVLVISFVLGAFSWIYVGLWSHWNFGIPEQISRVAP